MPDNTAKSMGEQKKQSFVVPPGFKFDPFADVRLGRSLANMRPEDWLVPESEVNP